MAKIGVVGRTGSGKTTLLLALFRMFELAYGRIVIDGVNIAALPLSEVRSRLAIIPQVSFPVRELPNCISQSCA